MVRKRGRPPKFGRPGRLVALTLPEDVVTWLQGIHPDPAWAIVSLCERQHDLQPRTQEHADVELVSIGQRRALIVVAQKAFGAVPGVSTIPLGAGRAFLALKEGLRIADLELAVIDRLDNPDLPDRERQGLARLREQLRECRREPGFACETRSIIIVEQTPAARTRAGRGGR
jgi:hypothetical protein